MWIKILKKPILFSSLPWNYKAFELKCVSTWSIQLLQKNNWLFLLFTLFNYTKLLYDIYKVRKCIYIKVKILVDKLYQRYLTNDKKDNSKIVALKVRFEEENFGNKLRGVNEGVQDDKLCW